MSASFISPGGSARPDRSPPSERFVMTLAAVAAGGVPNLEPAVRFALERSTDAAAVDALVDSAFGPGRFAKTAERLREGAAQRWDLSCCAWGNEALLGAVRLWSVRIGAEPALFLGPIEVATEHRHQGLAAALVARACDAARLAGDGAVLLVGAAVIFESMGFQAVPAGRVTLPGPVDPSRLLWRSLRPGATERLAGEVIGTGSD